MVAVWRRGAWLELVGAQYHVSYEYLMEIKMRITGCGVSHRVVTWRAAK